jgi:molecular chaperone GrpE
MEDKNLTDNQNTNMPNDDQNQGSSDQNSGASQKDDAAKAVNVEKDALESLKKRIGDLEEELARMENNWKRALADYKNFEKRMVEEKEQILNYAGLDIVASILPVLDNLELMDAHMNDTGLKLTVKEFKQILAGLGVKEVEAAGKDFDASCMEAIEVVDGEKNKVVEVLNKGYLLKSKLIRPARVKVGKGN